MFRVPFTVCLARASAALHRRPSTGRPGRRLRIAPALLRRAIRRPGVLGRHLRLLRRMEA
ncbi:MAG: hypothetical protein ACK5YI_07775 [Rhodospirillales bacterium]|jgi:hypothetical protein